MFDPALAGYWGSKDVTQATGTVLETESARPREGRRRQGLAPGRRPRDRPAPAGCPRASGSTTGGRFNYPDLIKGDELGHSDALLGISGRHRTSGGNMPCERWTRGHRDVRLVDGADSRAVAAHLPGAHLSTTRPAWCFLAYLNGHQDHFGWSAVLETSRDAAHLVELVRLAGLADVLDDPELAAARLAETVG